MSSDRHPSRRLRSVDKPVVDAQVAQARAALVMQRQGRTLGEIADALGLTEAATHSCIRTALAAAADLVDTASKRELLALEVSRLDALQAAHWDQAVNGDVRSADFILKVIDKRSKMLGLVDTDTDATTVQTVVVTGDSAAYIDALRSITTPTAIAKDDSHG